MPDARTNKALRSTGNLRQNTVAKRAFFRVDGQALGMAHAADSETLAVYADYVCPFCYLGKASLERYLADAPDPPEIEWRPFDLRAHKRGPDGAIDSEADDGKDDEYFAQVRENVERLRDRYDVDMQLEHARDVDSWNAQLVTLALEDRIEDDAVAAFHEAVFEALWVDARDIGDPDVLVDIAADVGIEEAVVRDALSDDSLEATLEERFQRAHQAGITAVPTFVYGDHAARGAVPPEQLRRLIDGV